MKSCAACGKMFHSGWTDEEADAEAKQLFGYLPTESGVVCDDCYDRYLTWLSTPEGLMAKSCLSGTSDQHASGPRQKVS